MHLSEEVCKLIITGCFSNAFASTTFRSLDHNGVANISGNLKEDTFYNMEEDETYLKHMYTFFKK